MTIINPRKENEALTIKSTEFERVEELRDKEEVLLFIVCYCFQQPSFEYCLNFVAYGKWLNKTSIFASLNSATFWYLDVRDFSEQ